MSRGERERQLTTVKSFVTLTPGLTRLELQPLEGKVDGPDVGRQLLDDRQGQFQGHLQSQLSDVRGLY
jgi:hypothetical protein